jgi:hypothetical protein
VIVDNRPWFAPKAYGIGAGLPIAWQGWAVMTAYVALMIADVNIYEGPARIAGGAIMTLSFIAITWAKTRGGWRWRWGERD